MAATKMIQSWQRSRIFGLARDLGMTTKSDDKSDDLHLLIDSRTGKDSLTKLTYDEANGVIGELDHRHRFHSEPAPGKPKRRSAKAGGVSARQQKFIWALMYDLNKYDPSPASLGDRLSGIIKEVLKIDATAKDPFRWLDARHGNPLTEAVKGCVASARKKAEMKDARSGAG